MKAANSAKPTPRMSTALLDRLDPVARSPVYAGRLPRMTSSEPTTTRKNRLRTAKAVRLVCTRLGIEPDRNVPTSAVGVSFGA